MNASAVPQPSYSTIVERSYPGIKVAESVTYEEIWSLFLESGFLYPEKIERLKPVLPELQNSVRTMLDRNGEILATIVLKELDSVDAHMSILRCYERTWMVQHLAARRLSARGMSASARLTLGFTYYGRLRPDIEWAKVYFRPNNIWPARVFGGYAKLIIDSPTSDLRTYHYMAASTDSPEEIPAGVDVRPCASFADKRMVEDWFRSRGRAVELKANHLEVESFDLQSLQTDYRQVGLERRRECLIAERNGHTEGFALLEISSLGLNFSELTNAFTIHGEDPEVRQALVAAAKRRYRELGRHQCFGLEESSDMQAFEACGFTHVKDYCCWIFHRDHLEGMEEYFVNLFTDRRSRRA